VLGPTLLCVAHPGHELRVYAWLAGARPAVAVVTDGSGRSGRSRIPATQRTLDETACTPGPFLGALTDANAYRAILARDAGPFLALADQLARFVRAHGVRSIVGDAAEGFNPVHDVCRLVINAACATVEVGNYEFPLTGRPDAVSNPVVDLRLDDDTFARKLAAARREMDLGVDVDEAVHAWSADVFRVERIRAAGAGGPTDGLPDEPPLYERYGEERVRSGKYPQVLRRREHVLPIAEALWRSAR